MKLYREVLIESVEQAEALPIGTVSSTATLPIFMKVSDEWWVGVHGSDSDDDERFENRHAVGITVLVPIIVSEANITEQGALEYDVHGRVVLNLTPDGPVGDYSRTEFYTAWRPA